MELLWQQQRLLLPVLLADGVKFVLLAAEKPARIAVETALLPRSVLGGYGGPEPLPGHVVLVAGVMNWTTYFVCMLGYVVALGILADWVPRVEQGDTSSIHWKWPQSLRNVSLLLLFCMACFFVTASVASWAAGTLAAENPYAFYAAFAFAAGVASLIFAWFASPFIRANGAGASQAASRVQSTFLLFAAVVLSLAIESEVLHEIGRDSGLGVLAHTNAGWLVNLFFSWVAAIPYAVSFVGMSLRSDHTEMIASPVTGEDECFE